MEESPREDEVLLSQEEQRQLDSLVAEVRDCLKLFEHTPLRHFQYVIHVKGPLPIRVQIALTRHDVVADWAVNFTSKTITGWQVILHYRPHVKRN